MAVRPVHGACPPITVPETELSDDDHLAFEGLQRFVYQLLNLLGQRLVQTLQTIPFSSCDPASEPRTERSGVSGSERVQKAKGFTTISRENPAFWTHSEISRTAGLAQ